MRLIAESTSNKDGDSEVRIDLSKLTRDFDLADLEAMQEKIDGNIYDMLYDGPMSRVIFTKKFTEKKTKDLLDSIGKVINDYKWSKTIPATEVFAGLPVKCWDDDRENIPYRILYELYSIYVKLTNSDKQAFLNTMQLKLNILYEPEANPIPEDDLPF